MTAETVFAPAKINLTLHVTGQRADGFHLLDSLVVFADVGDTLQVTAAPETTLCVTGPLAAGVPEDQRNLVWQAADLCGVQGAMRLEKHLPAAAGIGGGSSDAAAALLALSRMTRKDQSIHALRLGADVPVCLARAPTRMQGIGDRLHPVALPPLHAVLANAGTPVPTGKVFSAMAAKTNSPMPRHIPRFSDAQECIAWIATMRNDMEPACTALFPEIADTLAALRAQSGLRLARMSGSGGTCFGLFDDAAAAAAAAADIAGQRPAWWVRSCVLGAAPTLS